MAGPVVFSSDDVVGDYVVKPGIGVEPPRTIERDPAGPAIIAGYRRSQWRVSVVMNEGVLGGVVVAVDGGDAGTEGIGDGGGDETQVMGTAEQRACSWQWMIQGSQRCPRGHASEHMSATIGRRRCQARSKEESLDLGGFQATDHHLWDFYPSPDSRLFSEFTDSSSTNSANQTLTQRCGDTLQRKGHNL